MMNQAGAICRNCVNTGIGVTGKICVCPAGRRVESQRQADQASMDQGLIDHIESLKLLDEINKLAERVYREDQRRFTADELAWLRRTLTRIDELTSGGV